MKDMSEIKTMKAKFNFDLSQKINMNGKFNGNG